MRASICVLLLGIAATALAADCPGDLDGNDRITAHELVAGIEDGADVDALVPRLFGPCGRAEPAWTPTPTATGTSTRTPTRTKTRTRTPVLSRTPTGTITATRTRTPVPTPAPTSPPTGCMLVFTEDNVGGPSCVFSGPPNTSRLSCTVMMLRSTFVGDGDVMLVLFDEGFTFAALVLDPRTALLIGWFTDSPDNLVAVDGFIALTTSGESLAVFPDIPPFRFRGCDFSAYVGVYIGTNLHPGVAQRDLLKTVRTSFLNISPPSPAQ